jgi:hypothetical protein
MALAGSHKGIIKSLNYDDPTLREKLHLLCQLRERMSIPTSCFFELYETDYGKKL